jgi:hypothetical protein
MALDPSELNKVQGKSVQAFPEAVGGGSFFTLYLAGLADSIAAWGQDQPTRDSQLRQFWPTEPFLASTVGSMAARNGAFSWTLEGPGRTCDKVQEMLHASNFGRGWISLMQQVSIDLYCQDNGAFVEVIREGESPASPVLGLAHLDAGRVVRTGNLEYPFLYSDQQGGLHKLRPWQVIDFTDAPSPIETMNGVGLCAVSRLLRFAQVLRDVMVYQHEKVSGRNPSAVHLVSGIKSDAIETAIKQANANASDKGLSRFQLPVLIGTLDPTAAVTVATILLKSMPDQWDPENDRKWYIALMALAFGAEYQDLAPLPGGGLGSSNQSQILHMKARGKGSGLFMKMIEHRLNWFVLPRNVKFKFDEKDFEAERVEGEVKKLRAETRQIRIASGEISPRVARQIAEDEGDLKDEYLQMLTEENLTSDETVTDEARQQDPETIPAGAMVDDSQQAQPGAPQSQPTGQQPKPQPLSQPVAKAEEVDWEQRRAALEQQAEDEYAAVLTSVRDRIVKRLRAEVKDEP